MGRRNLVVVVVLVATFKVSTASAADYYVSPLGSDTTGNGSAATPWRTLQKAADLVTAGDRVTAKPGNYVGFDLRRSGTAAAPIRFLAEPGVLINQPSTRRTNSQGVGLDGINLEGASYIVIDGFSVSGMLEAGVRSVGSPSNPARFVTVRNVQATDNGVWGIFTGHVDDLLIEANLASGSFREHGIYVSNSGDRPVIRNNTIFDNHGSGIHMNGDLSQGGDGIISGAVVSGNRIFNNALPNSLGLGGGSGINMDGVEDSRIENNLLYNNHASGISLYKIDAAAGASGNVVVNNTIHQPSDGRWALNISNGSTSNTAFNNILLNEHSFRGAISIDAASLSGFKSDYNVLADRLSTDGGDTRQSLQQWRTSTGNDAHSLLASAAQLFVNPAGGATANYHLLATASAINLGTNSFAAASGGNYVAPTLDFDGLPRPFGARADVGAYEWRSPAATGDFNGDGTVNAADYAAWRNAYGTMVAPGTGADGDGSGTIGDGDYNVWRSNFGATTTTSAAGNVAAPEPASLLLSFAALAYGVAGRRRWAMAARSA